MMLIFKFLCYILMAYGFANMLVYSSGPFRIFEHIRSIAHRIHPQVGELFTCMMCISTWLGLFFSLIDIYLIPTLSFSPFNIIFGHEEYKIISVVMDMGFTSGAVWLLHCLDEMMERIGIYDVDSTDEQ